MEFIAVVFFNTICCKTSACVSPTVANSIELHNEPSNKYMTKYTPVYIIVSFPDNLLQCRSLAFDVKQIFFSFKKQMSAIFQIRIGYVI